MSTLNDTALGSNDESGTILSCADTLNVTAGDLVFAGLKWEGAITTVTFDTGASTPAFTPANAAELYTGNNDLDGATASWIATSTGTVTVRAVLGADRPFRKLKAYSVTPAATKTLQLGQVASAQSATGTPASGAASATAAGVAFGFFHLYGSNSMTAGTGWSEAAEFNITDAQLTEYQLQSGAGSLNADAALSGSQHCIAQLAIFNEAASGDTLMAQGLC